MGLEEDLKWPTQGHSSNTKMTNGDKTGDRNRNNGSRKNPKAQFK